MADWQGKRVLVVEDEPGVAGVLREIFELWGCKVISVEDGLGALSEVLAGEYDLITMDLHMPGGGGVRATELMRLRHGIQTPVVVISGYLDDSNQGELRSLGVRHFLEKPLDLDRLKQTVDTVLAA